jgi:hypothetical protein
MKKIFLVFGFISLFGMDIDERMLGTDFEGKDLSECSFDKLQYFKSELNRHLSFLRIRLVDLNREHAPVSEFQNIRAGKNVVERNLKVVQDALDDKRFDDFRMTLLRHLSRIPFLRASLKKN